MLLHPGLKDQSPISSTEELHIALEEPGELNSLQAVISTPAHLFDEESVRMMGSRASMITAFATRVDLSPEQVAWIQKMLFELLSRPITSGMRKEVPSYAVGLLAVIASRGYPLPSSTLESAQKMLKDEMMSVYYPLVRLPGGGVSEEMLEELWDTTSDRDVRVQILEHPAAGAGLRGRLAREIWSKRHRSGGFAGAELGVFVKSPSAAKDPTVHPILLELGSMEAVLAIVKYLEPRLYRAGWRKLSEHSQGWAAKMLQDASPEQLKSLYKADVLPLLSAADAPTRLAAIAAVGQIEAEVEKEREALGELPRKRGQGRQS